MNKTVNEGNLSITAIRSGWYTYWDESQEKTDYRVDLKITNTGGSPEEFPNMIILDTRGIIVYLERSSLAEQLDDGKIPPGETIQGATHFYRP